jgi:hypothetical protein
MLLLNCFRIADGGQPVFEFTHLRPNFFVMSELQGARVFRLVMRFTVDCPG